MFPFQVYGSWLSQTIALVILVPTLMTESSSNAMESVPVLLISVAVYDPAERQLIPFQRYGNWLLQIVTNVTTGGVAWEK